MRNILLLLALFTLALSSATAATPAKISVNGLASGYGFKSGAWAVQTNTNAWTLFSPRFSPDSPYWYRATAANVIYWIGR